MMSPIDIRFQEDAESSGVDVSTDALLLMLGCVNEALEAVGQWEFPIRVGFSVENARVLAAQIEMVIDARHGGRD